MACGIAPLAVLLPLAYKPMTYLAQGSYQTDLGTQTNGRSANTGTIST